MEIHRHGKSLLEMGQSTLLLPTRKDVVSITIERLPAGDGIVTHKAGTFLVDQGMIPFFSSGFG